MKRNELCPKILEGLIGIGYDIHIFDVHGSFPDGLSREEYENQRIDELFASQKSINKLAKLKNFTEAELTIGSGVATVDSLPFEAPWLSPYGACLIMITDVKRCENGEIRFQLGDENAKPYNFGNAWRKANDFFDEWPK